MVNLFLDPLFGRGYPEDVVEHYRGVSDFGFVLDGDLETISRAGVLRLDYHVDDSHRNCIDSKLK